jgi:hypothetical protein
MSTPWIVINFSHPLSPFICNLLGIFKPYVLRSLKDKFQNSYLNNKVFSRGKCWQQFIAQHIDTFTLCTNSTDNTFSILEIEPSESTLLHFFLLIFFFTPTTPTRHHLVYGFQWMQWDVFLRANHQESFKLMTISKSSWLLKQSQDN